MRGRVLMKKFYSTEASMIMRVLIYNFLCYFGTRYWESRRGAGDY
jgi:predicted negative regulator of RcsB-dependent stress response